MQGTYSRRIFRSASSGLPVFCGCIRRSFGDRLTTTRHGSSKAPCAVPAVASPSTWCPWLAPPRTPHPCRSPTDTAKVELKFAHLSNRDSPARKDLRSRGLRGRPRLVTLAQEIQRHHQTCAGDGMRARLRCDYTAAQVGPPIGLTGVTVHNPARGL